MKVLNNIVGLFNNAVLLEFFINPQYYKNLFVSHHSGKHFWEKS